MGLDLEKEEKIKNDTYPNIDNENYGLNNKEEKIKNNTYPSIENSSYEFTNFYLSEKFEGVYEDMLIELYNKNKPNMSIENYENLIYQFFNGDVEKYNYVQLSTLIDEKNNIIINQ